MTTTGVRLVRLCLRIDDLRRPLPWSNVRYCDRCRYEVWYDRRVSFDFTRVDPRYEQHGNEILRCNRCATPGDIVMALHNAIELLRTDPNMQEMMKRYYSARGW